jgi:hypothetical protein
MTEPMNDTAPPSTLLVASRKLRYTTRDSANQRPCTVGITAPREVARDQEGESALHDPLSACQVVFDGLPVAPVEVHGADSLQAIATAAEIDVVLRGLERQYGYDFFWDDGSPYFE